MMTLKVKLDENNIKGIITELEAKGCYEAASAIETAYENELIARQKAEYKQTWTRGFYRVHTDGTVDTLYVNSKDHTMSRKPIYIGGKVMGMPVQKSFNSYLESVTRRGFVEV